MARPPKQTEAQNDAEEAATLPSAQTSLITGKLREAHEAELARLRAARETEITKLREEHAAEITKLREELSSLKLKHAHAVGALRADVAAAAKTAVDAVEYAVSKGRINRESQMDKAFDGIRAYLAKPTPQ